MYDIVYKNINFYYSIFNKTAGFKKKVYIKNLIYIILIMCVLRPILEHQLESVELVETFNQIISLIMTIIFLL